MQVAKGALAIVTADRIFNGAGTVVYAVDQMMLMKKVYRSR